MKSFLPSLFKFILGIFLFGLAFWANPIEGYCATDLFNYQISSNGLGSNTPVRYESSSFTKNLVYDEAINRFGIIPFSSFDFNISLGGRCFFGTNAQNSAPFYSVSGLYLVYYDLLFTGYDGGAYSQPLGSSFIPYECTSSNTSFVYNFTGSTSCDGVPTGIRYKVYPYSYGLMIRSFDSSTNSVTGDMEGYDIHSSFDLYAALYTECAFTNYSFDNSSGGTSSTTVINNTSSNLVPIGYSSLNFGLNGNTYFLGASRIFEPSYLSPLIFSYDFANSLSGVISSSPLTLAMGGYDSPPNTAHASPIAVIGDTRAGEYELTIALCLTNSPSQAQLSALTNLSNWGFEFNRGYSGQQFSMPSNARVSYTNFTDSKTGYVYTSVYFYFTTPDYFDSFLIRKAPTLNNIRVGAFAFNKYTGTISDQLNQSDAQWSYDNPSHNSFTSANSSAASTVSAFSSIEADAFQNLDSAMSGAGVSDFNINVISTPLATVSAMINQTYNILPDLVKWLILAILVIGIFAVIISANNYVNKD